MQLLKIDDVGMTYQTAKGETQAIESISFAAEKGEFISIVGPSGCGKTTILSVISGLLKPSRGKILLDGKQITSPCGNIGYMLQRDQLFEWRTIEKNILLGLEIQKKLTDESAAYALSLAEKYGLKEFLKHYPAQLSGGMRQRVALIRTLAFRPDILLLDEPFSALDFQTRLAVCDDVYKIMRNEGITAVLVTHDISEAVSLSDRIICLSPRPAKVKNIYTIDIDKPSPLKRREAPEFSAWFDRIWKEVSV